MMTDREKEEFIQNIKQVLADLRNAIVDIINDIPNSQYNLQSLIKQWKEKRQILNNKNVGVLLSFKKPGIIIFPLHNDERDIGQKNLSSEAPQKEFSQEDVEFLKQIGIQLSE